MGDDVTFPNEGLASLGPEATYADLAQWVVDTRYYANVRGGSTWVVRTGGQRGRAIAVVTDPASTIRYLADPSTRLDETEAWLEYRRGEDPDRVVANAG
jgi:hypothetical protein